MILSLVLSKIKFQGRIISAAPPTRPGYLRTAAAGTSSLAPGDWHRLMRVNFTWILIILDDMTNERPHGFWLRDGSTEQYVCLSPMSVNYESSATYTAG